MFISINSLYPVDKFIDPLPMKVGEKLVFSVHVLGMYIGDQTISVDKLTTYKGRTVAEGWGTSVSRKKVFYLNDKEKTYFDPVTLDPLYNERWVHQGDWIDRLWFWFYPQDNKVEFKHNKGNNVLNTLNYKGRINSFYTMIAYMRSLDYDYYIKNNKTIDFGYLFGIYYKKASFTAAYTTVKYNNTRTPAVQVKENGGMGYEFVILLDQDRTPYKLVIPGDKLRMIITIKDLKRGTEALPR